MQETNYAICFATGSLLKPALIKLEQVAINFVPDLVEASNVDLYQRKYCKICHRKSKGLFLG